jgi:hypothetical protein
MNEMSWQYVAGFFDGEGSVGVYSNGKGNSGRPRPRCPTLMFTQANNAVLQKIRTFIFAELAVWGSLHPASAAALRTARKIVWQLQYRATLDVLKILNELRPYLHVKAVDADVVIAFCTEKISTAHLQCWTVPVLNRERRMEVGLKVDWLCVRNQ